MILICFYEGLTRNSDKFFFNHLVLLYLQLINNFYSQKSKTKNCITKIITHIVKVQLRVLISIQITLELLANFLVYKVFQNNFAQRCKKCLNMLEISYQSGIKVYNSQLIKSYFYKFVDFCLFLCSISVLPRLFACVPTNH